PMPAREFLLMYRDLMQLPTALPPRQDCFAASMQKIYAAIGLDWSRLEATEFRPGSAALDQLVHGLDRGLQVGGVFNLAGKIGVKGNVIVVARRLRAEPGQRHADSAGFAGPRHPPVDYGAIGGTQLA